MNAASTMHLEVMTPQGAIIDEEVAKVSAEATDGSFTLLPRHIDFVATLAPGLVAYVAEDGEHLLAVDGGVLVKRRSSVRIATPGAIAGDSVFALQRALRSSFQELNERERQSRRALAHLETDAIRRLIEMADDD
jgi:F-type H+-transporting ATPase subunit epsilon